MGIQKQIALNLLVACFLCVFKRLTLVFLHHSFWAGASGDQVSCYLQSEDCFGPVHILSLSLHFMFFHLEKQCPAIFHPVWEDKAELFQEQITAWVWVSALMYIIQQDHYFHSKNNTIPIKFSYRNNYLLNYLLNWSLPWKK